MAEVTMRIWRGDANGGDFESYTLEPERGRGRPRRHPPDPGDRGTRPGVPLELQGRQVRVVLGRDQRQAAPDVHDAHGPAARGPGDRDADEDLPDHPRPGDRRVVQLRHGRAGPGVPAPADARGRVPDVPGGRRARPGVPQVHRVLHVPGRLPRDPRPRGQQGPLRRARGSSSATPSSRCTRWTPNDRRDLVREEMGSATATSPSAAPRSAPSTSTSPTTRSSR